MKTSRSSRSVLSVLLTGLVTLIIPAFLIAQPVAAQDFTGTVKIFVNGNSAQVLVLNTSGEVVKTVTNANAATVKDDLNITAGTIELYINNTLAVSETIR